MELEKEELTLQDVIDVINVFAGNTQGKFESIDKRFESIDKRFENIDQKFDDLENNLRLEIGKARDAVLAHADTKSVDAVIESGKKINQHKEHDKNFKQKLISVMKNHDLASASELKSLAQTI
jgi:hypothetical protein